MDKINTDGKPSYAWFYIVLSFEDLPEKHTFLKVAKKLKIKFNS